ncbi:MAG: divergent PAP2 family protein [Candidatus Saccharimonadales bacterium]
MISPYLLAALAAWVVAQGAKYVVSVIRSRSVRKFRSLYVSGGMPSAHSATAMAVLVVVALKDGLDSGLFGVMALLAAIVMYDAMMVRRSSGKQGEIIQQLVKETGTKVTVPRFAKGHEPVEVAVGALVGTLVGAIVFFATI